MSRLREKYAGSIASVCLFLLTLALYWPVHRFAFINYDDPTYVTKNKHVKAAWQWTGVEWAFTTRAASNWHPLTWLSHMTDVQLWGLDPGGHHLTNAFLHAVNAVLVFLVCRRMTNCQWPSFFVAALFAWHPLRVESVAWISERKDVLSMFFFLLTLYGYALYVESRSRSLAAPAGEGRASLRRCGWIYAGTLVLFGLGLMSKPKLVTVPFVLLLLDFWPLQRAGI